MIKMMRKSLVVAAASLLLFSSMAKAIDQADPYKLIEEVGGKAFSRIASEQKAIQENPELLRVIVEEEMMPYVDYAYAAYKIIGNNMSKTDKEQRMRFVIAVREYLVQTYAQVLTKYEDQTVKYEPNKPVKDRKIVSVRASIIDPRRPDINLDFKLKLNKKSKEWKAFDMVVEGISLLNSKQAELGSLIRQKGIDEVARQLTERSKRPIVLDKKSTKTAEVN